MNTYIPWLSDIHLGDELPVETMLRSPLIVTAWDTWKSQTTLDDSRWMFSNLQTRDRLRPYVPF